MPIWSIACRRKPNSNKAWEEESYGEQKKKCDEVWCNKEWNDTSATNNMTFQTSPSSIWLEKKTLAIITFKNIQTWTWNVVAMSHALHYTYSTDQRVEVVRHASDRVTSIIRQTIQLAQRRAQLEYCSDIIFDSDSFCIIVLTNITKLLQASAVGV